MEMQRALSRWTDSLDAGNALLTRELRVALRSPRAWMLIALYVSILGAAVLAQFPFDEALTVPNLSGVNIGRGSDTAAQRGHDLLIGFVYAQAFLVWLLVPSLASGALAQERERQTLESLLLSPLSPLQIVWGKAAGVLATVGLLLLGTLPLTSLCFLLGGVSPGEVAGYYALLLTLAFLFTGIGLFCAATWTNPLRATLAAYALSAVAVPACLMLCGPGAVVSGLYILGCLLNRARKWLRNSTRASSNETTSKPNLRRWLRAIGVIAIACIACWLALQWLGATGAMWLLLCVMFIAPYGYFVSRFILQNAAQAISRRLDPEPPRREQVRQWQKTWRETMTTQPPLAPASAFALPVSQAAPTPQNVPASTWVPLEDSTRAAPRVVVPDSGARATPSATRAHVKATYDVKAFLPDNRNPIFARDLRHGLGGRTQTFFRYGYVVLIATELLLILYLMSGGGTSALEEQNRFAMWSRLQLVLVMLACAWLGSRAIAPEREGQTLLQLLSIPLSPGRIIGGKIASVLFFSTYVVLLGLPLTLIMPMLGLATWSSAIGFLLIEGGFALLCAAWGLSCSLWCGNVRNALGCALGGVAIVLLSGPLLLNALDHVYRSGAGSAEWWNRSRELVQMASPMHLISRAMNSKPSYYIANANNDVEAMLSVVPGIVGIGLLAVGLLAWAAHKFPRTAQSL